MKVCFPISEDLGIDSIIYGHFSSAPFFLIVDTESRETTTVANNDPDNPLYGCNPFAALKTYEIDGIVAAGMGDNALKAMNLCGSRVYEAQSENLIDNMEMFKREELPESIVQNSAAAGRCSGDDEGGESCGTGSCDHSHEH